MKKLIVVLLIAFSIRAFPCGKPGEPSNCGKEAVEVSDRTERMAKEFERDLEEGRLRERANMGLNAMVRFAIFKLRAKGHKADALKLEMEWESGWNGYLMRVGRDLGDHKPLSTWLAKKYAELEAIFGSTFMSMTRLVDLKIFNYGVPVVFSCVDNVNEQEFKKHFQPLAKITIYWTSFFACVGGTWGTGFLFCSPISMGCEFVTGKWIAPALNPTIWEWSCF